VARFVHETRSQTPRPAPSPRDEVHERVTGKKGSIPVSGRYSSRPLEGDYRIENKVLGSGMSGDVRLATSTRDGRQYAVKSFRKAGLSAKALKDLRSEVEIFLSLDHPHVARLEMVYDTEEVLHLVMEYMAGGELHSRLSESKQYTEEVAAETSHQMLLAVAYLHAHKIAHRDLKLENFLYERKDTNHLKLIDFGFAKILGCGGKMSQACGSIHYVAPEVLAHSYTEKADLWSMGVIAYMMLVGSPPFHGADAEVLRRIKIGNPNYTGSRFRKLSPSAQDFVRSLLVVNPKARLSAMDALEHPWITGRHRAEAVVIDAGILRSLQSFSNASAFRRALLSVMAWSLQTEDRIELRKQFLLLDEDNNGTITLKEFKAVLREHLHVDPAEAEALFRDLDADSNDEIEYSEFLAATLQGNVKVHENVLRRTFSRFDRAGSGLISADDLRSILGGSFEAGDIEELIQEVDTSGDGKIDYDEFIAYFHREEEALDDQDESSAQLRQGRRRRRTERLVTVIERLLAEPTEDQPGGGEEANIQSLPTLLQICQQPKTCWGEKP